MLQKDLRAEISISSVSVIYSENTVTYKTITSHIFHHLDLSLKACAFFHDGKTHSLTETFQSLAYTGPVSRLFCKIKAIQHPLFPFDNIFLKAAWLHNNHLLYAVIQNTPFERNKVILWLQFTWHHSCLYGSCQIDVTSVNVGWLCEMWRKTGNMDKISHNSKIN